MQISAKEALKSFGLSDKETEIYLATLELGSATANNVSEKAQINRSTTYDILKLFLEKGIASKTIVNNTTHFEVANPEKLISILDERKAKLESAIDEFKLIEKTTITKPTVRVYQGKSGFKTILNDVLITEEQISVISTSKVFDVMMYEFPHYVTERERLKIPARVIQEKSKQTDNLKKHDKDELRETRSLENLNAESMTWIYGDKVAIVKLVKNEIICISIDDKTISEDNRQMFEILWNVAE